MAAGGDLGNTTVVKNVIAGEEFRTRELVARAILEGGPATAVDLAAQLEITPTGVRRHLDSLVEEGVLESREPHLSSAAGRGRGRPAKVFIMTDGGREKFEHSYDDLAVMAIRFLSARLGDSAVSEFARFRADDLERRSVTSSKNLQRHTNESKSSRINSLAKFLTADGYAATTDRRSLGHELRQHHCPIAHVAAQYPQLCEAETEAFSRVLGTHVQRLATIAHGDGVCTTFVPDLDLVRGGEKSRKSRSSKKATRGSIPSGTDRVRAGFEKKVSPESKRSNRNKESTSGKAAKR